MFFSEVVSYINTHIKNIYFQSDIHDVKVNGITADSRSVSSGFIFAAIHGFKTDGIKYVHDAVKNNAVAVITQAEDDICAKLSKAITVIQVNDTREVFAILTKCFYCNADEKLDIIGVTGTNGKTSVTAYISHIMNKCFIPCATLGTLGSVTPTDKYSTERTTPEVDELFELFRKFSDKGIKAVAMEVSSHALELKRVSPLNFKIAVFTNLSVDHLDFHKTMYSYMKAKEKLFYQCDIAVINSDDEYGKEILYHIPCNKVTYSINDENAQYRATNISYSSSGTSYTLVYNGNKKFEVKIKTPGVFSVYNSLAAISATAEYGLNIQDICDALSSEIAISGRFESINNGLGINIILDYAHTPDGIKNVLTVAREFTKGRLISVFGCGGERDASKRSKMGLISSELADYTIITSDNPRNENEIEIAYQTVKDIAIDKLYNIIIDRRNAIEHAIKTAKNNDSVIIMGKGHETTQQFGNIKFPFSDKDIIRSVIEKIQL